MSTSKKKKKAKTSLKTFWLMFFILILGTALRLIFINKPDGLWNDEYISWQIAAIPLGQKFIDAVVSQCHMPFYYLYLKFFIHFFGNSDLMLRLTSVITGILAIPAMYFVGKEFKDTRLGILCAAMTALSSFSIYFSQEVRFYSLLFLFASLSLLFTLRLGRKQTLSNFIFYLIFNLLIIFTHTIGFIFVIFNLIFLSVWLLKTDNKYKKPIIAVWSVVFLLGLFASPLGCRVATSHPLSQWWGTFTLSRIGFLITDYFSPILINIVSAPDNFFFLFGYGAKIALNFVIFAIFPLLIAIAGMVKAFKIKDFKILGLFYVCLAYVLVLIVMAISGKLMFITKYSIEIYPILLLITAFGLMDLKSGWRKFLIFSFIFLNLFYVLVSSHSAPRMHRAEGHKIVADLLKNADLNPGDIILLNYYPKDRFEKYFDFDKYSVISINKGNFSEYLGVDSKEDFKTLDKKYFDKKFVNDIINIPGKELGRGKKLAVVILNDVAIYSPVQMQLILNDENQFKKAPFLFLVFSELKNDIFDECLKYLQIQRGESKGSWTVVTFSAK